MLFILPRGFIGLYHPQIAFYLKPVGDIFLNLIYVLIVPLTFCGIVSSIVASKESSQMRKIFMASFLLFFIFSLVACIVSLFIVLTYNPATGITPADLLGEFAGTAFNDNIKPVGELIVSSLSVSNIGDLLNKSNILPLIIFAFLFGISVRLYGEKAAPIKLAILSLNGILMTFVKLIMKVAPVGLGCYFAYMISKLGAETVKSLGASAAILIIGIFGFPPELDQHNNSGHSWTFPIFRKDRVLYLTKISHML